MIVTSAIHVLTLSIDTLKDLDLQLNSLSRVTTFLICEFCNLPVEISDLRCISSLSNSAIFRGVSIYSSSLSSSSSSYSHSDTMASSATVLSPDGPATATAAYSGPTTEMNENNPQNVGSSKEHAQAGRKPAGWRHFVAGG